MKEVLERMRVTGTSRAVWPVIEVDGQVAWMKGVELEPQPGIVITVTNRSLNPLANASVQERQTMPLSSKGKWHNRRTKIA